MNLETALDLTNFALDLLGEKYCSDDARVLLIATGLQESNFQHRFQIKGPARSYWQFEKYGGLRGVIEHSASKNDALELARSLDIQPHIDALWEAFPYDVVLAAGYARLLYWTHPAALPQDAKSGWQYYLDVWRPGKPHPETWAAHWQTAYELVHA